MHSLRIYLLDLSNSVLDNDELVSVEDVVYVQGVDQSGLDARNVCCAADYLIVLLGKHDKSLAVCAKSGEHLDDFLGLVEALLSQNTNCLNNNDTIYDSVIESLNSKKRPKDDAPILHCHVNSISGGTMTAVTQQANTKLTQNLHFIFEAAPDPAYQSKRMILYMYYETDIDDAEEGQEIMVYKQIVSRGNDGVWFADGTYIGRAEVGEFFEGGNSGKDVWTINPYSWKYGLPNA